MSNPSNEETFASVLVQGRLDNETRVYRFDNATVKQAVDEFALGILGAHGDEAARAEGRDRVSIDAIYASMSPIIDIQPEEQHQLRPSLPTVRNG